jgi:hypothetical protein
MKTHQPILPCSCTLAALASWAAALMLLHLLTPSRLQSGAHSNESWCRPKKKGAFAPLAHVGELCGLLDWTQTWSSGLLEDFQASAAVDLEVEAPAEAMLKLFND